MKRAMIGLASGCSGSGGGVLRPRMPTSTPISPTNCTRTGSTDRRTTTPGSRKITCKRLDNGLDTDANKSAQFIHMQLVKDSTTDQAWQFLGATLRNYCPDKMPILEQAAR